VKLVRLEDAGERVDARRIGGVHLDHPVKGLSASWRLVYPRKQVCGLFA